MKLCFYNMFHIGDIYIYSTLFNVLCELNENVDFYYFAIQGDIFFNKQLKNLKKIGKTNIKYSKELVNGEPPENLLNNDSLKFLESNRMDRCQFKNFKICDEDTLWINTHCIASSIKHSDYDLCDAITGLKKLINEINLKYNLNLKFEIQNKLNLFNNPCIQQSETNKLSIDNDTIFLFNYKPRSFTYDLTPLYKMIIQLSKTNKVMVSCYDSILSNYNVEFFDKKYNITPEPSCFNLIKLWDIIINCKKIFILPCGGCWTFMHRVNEIKKEQIFMINSEIYTNKLNKNINWFLDNNINLITNINI